MQLGLVDSALFSTSLIARRIPKISFQLYDLMTFVWCSHEHIRGGTMKNGMLGNGSHVG